MKRGVFQVGFSVLLTLIFITLKLTNVIDWSWWWILFPIWIGVIALAVIIIGFVLMIYFDDGINKLVCGKIFDFFNIGYK